ncbi:MAG: phosphodiester glycosidase family protein [Acidobacteriota bacterium]|nr:MAG: phosphodiester glycosidase family protein [Acidobacteriota bacterium]
MPWEIHILTVDPTQYRVVAERATGKGLGRETVSSMAKRRNAVAAINGGFFRIGGKFDGEPVGILKVDDRWYSDPGLPRAALGWNLDQTWMAIDRLLMDWQVRIGELTYPVDGINRVRGATETLLFTAAFNATTLAGGGGCEVAVWPSGRRQVFREGNASIPEEGFVVSFGSRSGIDVAEVPPGAPVEVTYRFRSETGQADADEEWKRADFIVGGTPILLRNGQLMGQYEAEKVKESFITTRHPRTAVCRTSQGSWIFVVVDGRRPQTSVGMTLDELAGLMLELGCEDAMNLDGGGSSTFYLYGSVVNLPSDVLGERPVSDAILILNPDTE